MLDQIIQIKRELKNKKITYEKFSSMCGIPHSTLSQIFNGKTANPRIETVQAMLEALDLEPQLISLTDLEQEIIGQLRDLTEHQQMMVLAYISGLKDRSNIATQHI